MLKGTSFPYYLVANMQSIKEHVHNQIQSIQTELNAQFNNHSNNHDHLQEKRQSAEKDFLKSRGSEKDQVTPPQA